MQDGFDHYWPSVSESAHSLVFGARGRVYSHPFDDYSKVVEIMEAIAPDDFGGGVNGEGLDGAVLLAIMQMIAVKLARLRTGFELGFSPDVMRDHFVDACGYIDCLYGAFVREYEYAADDLLLDDLDDDLEQ